jgi:hypothetical protein
MALPIKRLQAEPDIVRKLRRRSRSITIGVRDRERAEIIPLRLNSVGVEAVAARLNTTAKRVSTWSRRFEISGLKGLDERPGRGRRIVDPSRPGRARCHRGDPIGEWENPLEYPTDEPPCRHLG